MWASLLFDLPLAIQGWKAGDFMAGDSPLGDFESLHLDSASSSIAQELLRTQYKEARKLFSERVWAEELLSGSLSDDKLLEMRVGPEFKQLNEKNCWVCLIEEESLAEEKQAALDPETESALTHVSFLLRAAFEKTGFRPVIAAEDDRLAVIAFDLKGPDPSKLRLLQALETLPEKLANGNSIGKPKQAKLQIGVSQCHNRLKHASAGYREAAQALSLLSCFHRHILFFEELGVYQLLLGANDGKTLQSFVERYLGPLIEHDRTKGSELLLTLKVFLDHDASKQLAAQKLFIVRQSLYYRLEKIEELLGEDFMSPEHRLAIQVSLRAYQMLHPGSFAEPAAKQAHR
jgi:purine catabolism regulator